jgi:hypothetical protein
MCWLLKMAFQGRWCKEHGSASGLFPVSCKCGFESCPFHQASCRATERNPLTHECSLWLKRTDSQISGSLLRPRTLNRGTPPRPVGISIRNVLRWPYGLGRHYLYSLVMGKQLRNCKLNLFPGDILRGNLILLRECFSDESF